MTNPIAATLHTADALALAADLPRTLYFSQDGGYFYLFASPERDTDWREPDANPTLMFVDTGHDPSFFDPSDVLEAIQAEFVASLPSFKLIWSI